jgi:glycerol uptake facilitator-like aquaporin
MFFRSFIAVSSVSLSMKVVAPGLMVMAVIYFMGTASGAHLNPAVTLAFERRQLSPGYDGQLPSSIIGVALSLIIHRPLGRQL